MPIQIFDYLCLFLQVCRHPWLILEAEATLLGVGGRAVSLDVKSLFSTDGDEM